MYIVPVQLMTTGGRAVAGASSEVKLASVGGWALGSIAPTLTLMGSSIPEFHARGNYAIEEGCESARGTQGWRGGDLGTLVSIASGMFSCPQPRLCGHFRTVDHSPDVPRTCLISTVLVSMAFSSMIKLTRARKILLASRSVHAA